MSETTLNVLVIEKEPLFAPLLRKAVLSEAGKPLQIESASSLAEGMEKLSQRSFDLILLDPFLSESEGIETLRMIPALAPQASLPPLILLVDPAKRDIAAEAVKTGVYDYFVKGKMGEQEVLEAVERVVERHRIFADWKMAVDRAFVQATRDPLTGLPNRFLLQDRLVMALSEARRHGEILGILFIDLDHLKEINDLLGHDAGDEALAAAALRFSECLRSEDTVARVGGDEFVALIRHLRKARDAQDVAVRLLQNLYRPLILKGRSFSVTASIGISLYPRDGQDKATLLKKADSALLRVKQSGGDGYNYFTNPEEEKAGSMALASEERALSTRRILIAEDDEDVRVLLEKRLKNEGYSCLGCRSVEEALSALKSFKPDLVILDLGFREASGLALLQNLTKHVDPDQTVPAVLVVSGYSDPEIVQFATTLGASGFIPKPIDTSQIISAVRSLVH